MNLALAFEGLLDPKYYHTINTLIPITWSDHYTYCQAMVTYSEYLHAHRATLDYANLPVLYTIGSVTTTSYWVAAVYYIQRLATLCYQSLQIFEGGLTSDIKDNTDQSLIEIQQTLGALTWVRTRAFLLSSRTHPYKEELEKLHQQIRAYGLWLIGRKYMQAAQWHKASDVFYTVEKAQLGNLSEWAKIEKVFARAHELEPAKGQAILRALPHIPPVIAEYLLTLGPESKLDAKSPLLIQTYALQDKLLILGLDISAS